MPNLHTQSCTPCRSSSPTLNKIEISRLMEEVPGYQLHEVEGIKRICKTYTFKNFEEALVFTNKIARVAEEEHHHPQIILEWGAVTVSWWTHAIDGLDTNDFIMAVKTDQIY